jgi:AcrR family transcriptional regulator
MPKTTRISPPLQERSARTLERIVEATEELLRTKSLEQVTIREIVRRAKCPIASFYARFKSKDDLLPHLYERYDARLGPEVQAKIARVDFESLDLRTAVELCVDLIIDSYSRDKWLMREVALFARRNPGAIGKDARKNRTGLHSRAAEVFAPFAGDIRHKNPVRAAEVAIFLVAAIARETVLFGEAPHATATALSREALRATLVHTFLSFLTTPCESPHLCCSPPSRRLRR